MVKDEPYISLEGITFSDLVTYIEEAYQQETSIPVVKLSELATLYRNRLKELGGESTVRPHTKRLKEKLLRQIQELNNNRVERLFCCLNMILETC